MVNQFRFFGLTVLSIIFASSLPGAAQDDFCDEETGPSTLTMDWHPNSYHGSNIIKSDGRFSIIVSNASDESSDFIIFAGVGANQKQVIGEITIQPNSHDIVFGNVYDLG